MNESNVVDDGMGNGGNSNADRRAAERATPNEALEPRPAPIGSADETLSRNSPADLNDSTVSSRPNRHNKTIMHWLVGPEGT